MAQKFSLYGELSVSQNLDLLCGAYNLDRARARRAKDAMVEIFDLGEKLSMNSAALPLGFKQRLALACAVMHEPPVLFLDEPTSGVDPVTRRMFWTHINGLVEKGVTVLVTTILWTRRILRRRFADLPRRANRHRTPDALKAQADALDRSRRPNDGGCLHRIDRGKRPPARSG